MVGDSKPSSSCGFEMPTIEVDIILNSRSSPSKITLLVCAKRAGSNISLRSFLALFLATSDDYMNLSPNETSTCFTLSDQMDPVS
jgi:hypothetical protein